MMSNFAFKFKNLGAKFILDLSKFHKNLQTLSTKFSKSV